VNLNSRRVWKSVIDANEIKFAADRSLTITMSHQQPAGPR
jgi:hypothetical protein